MVYKMGERFTAIESMLKDMVGEIEELKKRFTGNNIRTREDLDHLFKRLDHVDKRRIKEDSAIFEILEDHRKRLDVHDKKIEELKGYIDTHDRDLTKISHRIEELKKRSEGKAEETNKQE